MGRQIQEQKTKARRPRGTGRIYRRPNSPMWWVQYSKNGQTFRESTQTTKRKEAEGFLRNRLAEITTGKFVGLETERVRMEELAADLLRDYRINGRATANDVETRWELHLKPFFGVLRAKDVTSTLIARYVDARQQEGAENATINRELAALKRAFNLGYKATPPKVHRVPAFSHLKENNVRTGFLEDNQYHKLVDGTALWFRTLVEYGRTYGWRAGELSLRVKQVNLIRWSIRLEPGTTKNDDGREVTMTSTIYALLAACVAGKKPDDFVFTRPNGKPVRSFRETWEMQCTKAGLGQLFCRNCAEPQSTTSKCTKCGFKGTTYKGLLFHDLRRTAARNLRGAGVAENVIMKIGGWRTRSVFDRYSIVDQADIKDAMQKLEIREAELKDKAHLRHTEPNLASPVAPETIQ
jgi:hypothetical protein